MGLNSFYFLLALTVDIPALSGFFSALLCAMEGTIVLTILGYREVMLSIQIKPLCPCLAHSKQSKVSALSVVTIISDPER